MITAEKAYEYFKKKFSGLTVKWMADYDKKSYLLCAVVDPKKMDFDDGYYMVSKSDGSVYGYSPMKDLEGLYDAYLNRQTFIKDDVGMHKKS